MKRLRILVSCIVFLGFLAIPSALLSYDTSPSNYIVVPECIWAPATGGGTWVTQLQITALTAGATIVIQFYSSGGQGGSVNLWMSPGPNSCVKFSNILSALQSRDSSGFTYYGKVGSLYLWATSGHLFQCQARTINGNYGKTLPGLRYDADGNSAAVGRKMMIQDLTQNAVYRTFVGVCNFSAYNMDVQFVIYTASGTAVGSFWKTVLAGPRLFMSFNPFVEAGLGSGSYDNCWLYIWPWSGPGDGPGLFCFGSLANNYTNDTSALMAVQFQ